AALRQPEAEARTAQLKLVGEHIEERRVRACAHRPLASVDVDLQLVRHGHPSMMQLELPSKFARLKPIPPIRPGQARPAALQPFFCCPCESGDPYAVSPRCRTTGVQRTVGGYGSALSRGRLRREHAITTQLVSPSSFLYRSICSTSRRLLQDQHHQ